MSAAAPAVVPSCPTHGIAMKMGKFGFYCPTRMPDGSWCPQTVRFKPKTVAEPLPNVVPLPQPVAVPQSAQAGGYTGNLYGMPPVQSDAVLKMTALTFAEKIFQGSGNSGDALALARDAYEFLREG